MQPVLFVGNRNYSSWSLRPWLALKWSGLSFETRVINLGAPGYGQRQVAEVLRVSATGTVPALHLGAEVIADSLAICEWAAEQVPGLWPADALTRAVARSAVCEMHSGFAALRGALPCNIRRRAAPRTLSEEVCRDVERIEALWSSLRGRFAGDGPYLFGGAPTIVDAFFAPVATRFRTYGVPLSDAAQCYATALLADPAFLEWEREAEREEWSIPQQDRV